MYRVAIVEDENEAVEAIEKCLVRYSSDEGINFDVMVYDTGLKFLDAYSPAFDIVFMDIEMPDIDGIKTAEKLRQMDSCVGLVFITNLARYAIKGYEYDALDYILKPLSYPAFKLKLDRIFQRIKKNDKKIIITTRTGQNAVGINSIYYVEVSGHNLIYHTETGDYSEYGTLKEVLKKLPETQFMKCNNCYLVNLGHVRGYDGSVLTVGDYKIEISRSRKKDFISAYNAYRMAGEAMIIDKIWGTVSYVGAVYLAAFLVASGMSKRRCFVSLAILLGVVAAAISFGYEELIRYLNLDRLVTLALRTSNCFLIFIMVLVSVRICFICHRWEALFCATAGYCMEHISQRLVAIINVLSDGLDKYVEGTLLIVVTSVFYIVMYIFVIRKTSPAQRIADGKVQIIVSIVTLMVAIFVNSFASVLISSAGEEKLSVFVHIFSMLSCMLILFVEFYQIKYRGAVMEQNILEQIIHQERESYERERSAVDVINIKCHDLKHQLSALKGKIDGNEYKELKDAVYAYDSVFKTGNEALDTVLYMKGMDCEANNISLTCLADGKLLKFMADSDVYSLFGNILDNAIEACRQIADIGKRIILFNIYKTGNIANIDIINYFGGGVDSISLKDGLPQTTKADKNYHGFGMSSIKRIVDKYEGSLCVKVNRDEFTLGISFFV